MINYHDFDLMQECMRRYYELYSKTLDTSDYVPKDSNQLIFDVIDKFMKKKIRDIKREERRYKRMLKRLIRSGRIPDTISSQSVLLDYGIFTPNKRITNNNTDTPGEAQEPPATVDTSGEAQEPLATADTPSEAQEPPATVDTPGVAQEPPATVDTPGEAQEPPATAAAPGEAQEPPATAAAPSEAQEPPATADTPGEAQEPPATADTPGVFGKTYASVFLTARGFSGRRGPALKNKR